MSASFLDTNVVVYAASSDQAKVRIARQLLDGRPSISVQVLNEFASVARSKLRWPLPRIESFLEGIKGLAEVHPLTLAIHERGLRLAERYQFHLYDAMIVAAALEAESDTLYSEDMQHGLMIEDRLTILNPFA